MSRPLTGRDVLMWVVAFFALIIAVNVYFIYAAASTFRGEDEQKPYLQGVEYNETLARRATQDELAWRARIGAKRLPTGNVRIDVMLTGPDGRPIANLPLSGELRHPVDETRDRKLRLVAAMPGDYEGELRGVSTGAWDVVVSTPQNSTPFVASRRLWVP